MSNSEPARSSESSVSQPGRSPAKKTDGRMEYTRSRVRPRHSASSSSMRPPASMAALSAPADEPVTSLIGSPRLTKAAATPAS